MKIFIDPGHGGTDSGAVANGIREKEPNLTVAFLVAEMLTVAEILTAHGIEVIMSRTTDTYMTLPERTNMANDSNVDAFISIHHNAAANAEARGLEIYHSIVGGEGKRLAELIHDRYRALIPELPSRGVRTRKGNNGRDYYHVIRATRMPAVIIEGGFLTNSQDAALIKTRDYLERQAHAISQAVLKWYRLDIGNAEGTQIMGPAQATILQAQEWARGRRAHQRFIDIAPEYWRLGQAIGIRPEVAYAQSAKETAFGRYGGAVQPEQNNWAGIKTANAAGDRPEDHESFTTPEDGVRAHFNHLAAYVGLKPMGQPHGRYHIVKDLGWAGSVRHVEELGGRWAPAADYGESIVRDYLTGMLATETPGPEPDDHMSELEARIAQLEEKLAAIKAIVE